MSGQQLPLLQAPSCLQSAHSGCWSGYSRLHAHLSNLPTLEPRFVYLVAPQELQHYVPTLDSLQVLSVPILAIATPSYLFCPWLTCLSVASSHINFTPHN